jgi:hypothetical protein
MGLTYKLQVHWMGGLTIWQTKKIHMLSLGWKHTTLFIKCCHKIIFAKFVIGYVIKQKSLSW